MNNAVPDGWKLKTIGEIGNVITGSTPSTQQPSYWDGEIPFISPADFAGRIYVERTERTLTENGAKKSRLLPKNSILVTCIGSLGGMAMSSKASVTNQQINAVVAGESQNSRFHFYNILFNIHELIRSAGTTTLPIINKSTFAQINILFPPLPEQKKIAAILTSVDEVIEKTRAQIDKLKDLKTGMMQELLTKGIGPGGVPHTEFKDSPVGRIPSSWEVKSLSSLVSPSRLITYGIVQTGENITDGIPCVRVVDLMRSEISPKNMIRTSFKISQQYKRTILMENDIMFALRGSIGHVRLACSSLAGANLTRGIALISPSNLVNPQYLLWALRSPGVRQTVLDGVNGSALQEIPLGNLRNVQVPVPSKEEQLKISNGIDSVEGLLRRKNQKLSSIKKLKKALMQDLLTGKVRVQVDTRELAKA